MGKDRLKGDHGIRDTAKRLFPALLALLLAGLIVTAAYRGSPVDRATAQEDSAEEVTVRYLPLPKIVKRISEEAIPEEGKTSVPVLLCWIVDNAKIMAQNGVFAQLASALAEARLQAGADTQVPLSMAVVAFGQKAVPLTPPTRDMAVISSALKSLREKPDDGYKNCMKALRDSARAYDRFKGRKVLVLFTPENSDSEDDPEGTLRFLKSQGATVFVISREAVYSDPFWQQRASPVRFRFHGPETAEIEFPGRWTLQYFDPHEGVPSGFGCWGMSRIASETGGKYFLYYPDGEGRCYCSTIGCPLCSGQHLACDFGYTPGFLRYGHEPDLRSRAEYRQNLSRCKLYLAYVMAWQTCYELGLFDMGPPFRPGTTTGESTRRCGPRGGHLLPRGSTAALNSPWAGWKANALAAIPKAEATRKALRRTAKRYKSSAPPRIVAACDTFDAALTVTLFNLKQLVLYCDLLQKRQKSMSPRTRIWIRKYPFCHGTKPLEGVEFLGDSALSREKKRMLKRIQVLLQKYALSPWGLVIKRLGVAYFEEYIPQPGGRTTWKRPPPRGKQAEKPQTGPTRPTTSRPKSGGRTGRPTTGR
jgi:hypothetical protein